jgi:phosphoribosylamine--glycine ligase
MVGREGPKLIEFNVRFGDPEAQVILPRVEEDLLSLLLAAAEGRLEEQSIRLSKRTALTVVMAARGYPEKPERGTEIKGLDRAAAVEGVTIYHAGTRRLGDRFVADGGRVLDITAVGDSIQEARALAYAAITRIEWPGGFCRSDIGWRALARAKP